MTSLRWIARLIITLVVVDLVLIAINVHGAPSFLDFDEEKNFTTWYSSAKLFLTALAGLWCARLEPEAEGRRSRRWWQVLAALFIALSMDETATAHERLSAWLLDHGLGASLRARINSGDAAKDAFLWPILFSPVIVAILYFLVTFLWGRLRRDRRALVLALCGSALFAASVVLEGPAVYTSPPVESWGTVEIYRYKLLSVWEETAEAVGATLMLASLLIHARSLAGAESPSGPIE